jgi:UPF0176 protein
MKVLLYYKYIAVADPVAEAEHHRAICKELELKGRIFISAEGINGTCSGTEEAIEKYKAMMNAHPLFSGIAYKESEHPTHVFAKLFVRHRPEVVALKADINPKDAAPYITPQELHEELERGGDVVLIDMRNDYEAAIGQFKNAVVLPMQNFRDLPDHMPALQQYEGKKVVTYCTGGIRCEKASALLRKHGFSDVRQLEGGIVKYCEQFPDGYFEGSLFVFDARLSVRFPGKRKPMIISSCAYCKTPCDRYIDCAELSCHQLCICCEECEKKNYSVCNKHQKASDVK